MTVYMKSIRVQKVFKATRLDEITRETNIASKREEVQMLQGRGTQPQELALV